MQLNINIKYTFYYFNKNNLIMRRTITSMVKLYKVSKKN